MSMTLMDYQRMCVALFGAESKSAAYFADKISKAGGNERVLADHGQVMYLIQSMETAP